MRKQSKWGDFLFAVAVRFVCGAVLGVLASILICAPISRYAARRPLLLWVFGDEAHPRRPYYWFGAWSLGGALIAVFRIPHWQTPWYKGIRDSDDDNAA